MCDIFGDDDDCTGSSSSDRPEEVFLRNETQRMYNNGYRTNKVMVEEKLIQDGFDAGFENGMKVGRLVGALYAKYTTGLGSISETDTRAKDISIDYTKQNNTRKLRKMNKVDKVVMIDLPAKLQQGTLHEDEELFNQLRQFAEEIPHERLRKEALRTAQDLYNAVVPSRVSDCAVADTSTSVSSA